jgi:hypothetical protein
MVAQANQRSDSYKLASGNRWASTPLITIASVRLKKPIPMTTEAALSITSRERLTPFEATNTQNDITEETPAVLVKAS